MLGKSILATLQLFVALAPLMQNDIDDFILVADVLRWLWHELVDDLTEKADVSPSIVPDAGDKFRDRALVL